LIISALPAGFGFLRSPSPCLFRAFGGLLLSVWTEIAFRAGTGGLHSAEN
jgi:hypothetical protein